MSKGQTLYLLEIGLQRFVFTSMTGLQTVLNTLSKGQAITWGLDDDYQYLMSDEPTEIRFKVLHGYEMDDRGIRKARPGRPRVERVEPEVMRKDGWYMARTRALPARRQFLLGGAE